LNRSARRPVRRRARLVRELAEQVRPESNRRHSATPIRKKRPASQYRTKSEVPCDVHVEAQLRRSASRNGWTLRRLPCRLSFAGRGALFRNSRG
jgi:hypothetical protein